MYCSCVAILCALAVCCSSRAVAQGNSLQTGEGIVALAADSPFADAQFVPADVTVFVHIENGAALRKQLAQQPVGSLMANQLGDELLGEASSQLVKLSGKTAPELFDTLLGSCFTLVTQRGENEPRWTIITRVSPESMNELRRAWRVQRQLPKNGFALSLLPEQDILLAERGETVIIGPRTNATLLETIVSAQNEPLKNSLADQPKFAERAAALGSGRCAIYITNGESVGGSSLFIADLNGSSVRLKQSAQFDRPPFSRDVTKLNCDFSIVRNFERDQLFTIIEPTDIGPTQQESFVYQMLGDVSGASELQKVTGPRRIFTIGEEEGRLREIPEDVLAPVPAVAIEIDGDKYTIAQLDVRMTRIATALNDVKDGALLIDVPPPHAFKAGHARRIDLSPVAESFTGGFPIMRNVSLNWRIVESDGEPSGGAWCVIAGSPQELDSVVKSLETPCKKESRLIGTFDSVGSINGVRVSQQLSTWKNVAGKLAPQGEQQQFTQAIDLLSQLAGGAERICWQMRRPARNEMLLDVQIKLREEPSAEN